MTCIVFMARDAAQPNSWSSCSGLKFTSCHISSMNTMRVFLHDLLWQQDADGFKKRIDEFLTIAAKHRIRPVFVLFDSCWDPLPHPGPQHPPIPGENRRAQRPVE